MLAPQLGLFYIPAVLLCRRYVGNAVNLTDGLLMVWRLCRLSRCRRRLCAGGPGDREHELANYLHIPYLRHAGELVIVCTAIVGAGLDSCGLTPIRRRFLWAMSDRWRVGRRCRAIAVLLRQEFPLAIMGGVFVVETSVGHPAWVPLNYAMRIFRMAPIHHHYELKRLAGNRA